MRFENPTPLTLGRPCVQSTGEANRARSTEPSTQGQPVSTAPGVCWRHNTGTAHSPQCVNSIKLCLCDVGMTGWATIEWEQKSGINYVLLSPPPEPLLCSALSCLLQLTQALWLLFSWPLWPNWKKIFWWYFWISLESDTNLFIPFHPVTLHYHSRGHHKYLQFLLLIPASLQHESIALFLSSSGIWVLLQPPVWPLHMWISSPQQLMSFRHEPWEAGCWMSARVPHSS